MKSDMENKDWINDYASLKLVSPANPFTVPAGYFEGLGDHIASRKNLDELMNNGAPEGHTTPANYFKDLEQQIKSRVAIENILNGKDSGFTIPDDYFNNLEQQIKSRVAIEEALNGQPEYFTVPQDYFNRLNKNILDKTVKLDDANRRGIVRKLFASTAFKYATAACFALVIGGGILLTELSNPADAHKNSFLHKQLSSVPIDDIKTYLQLNVDPGDTQQSVVSDGTAVDDNKLKNALKNDIDSVQ